MGTYFVNILSTLLRSPWGDLQNKGDLSHEKILYLKEASGLSILVSDTQPSPPHAGGGQVVGGVEYAMEGLSN
jgi:hypothetical protein